MDEHVAVIKAQFSAHPPMSVAQAMEQIKQLTGVQLQQTRVRTFLRALGMAPRRLSPTPGGPGKADPLVQAEFKKTAWIPY